MSWSSVSSPFWIRISRARSQYTVARAFLPLLFAGITKSNFEVRLSVLETPITGTPAFVASITACESTGATMMLGRFMPGTLTNPSLPFYTEPQIILISDPQVDAQAVTEATNAGIPVIGVSNTDNLTSKLDLVIPANNRGRKALATVYWLLAREILIQKGELTEDQDMKYEIDDFETKIKDIEEDESY